MSRKLFFIGVLSAIVSMIYTVLLILNKEDAEGGQLIYQVILQAIYFHTIVIFFLSAVKRKHSDLHMVHINWYFLFNAIGITCLSYFIFFKEYDSEIISMLSVGWFALLSFGWFSLIKGVTRFKIFFE